MQSTLALLLLMLAVTLSACGSEGSGTCTAGEPGCACGPSGSCADGVACDTATNTCEGTRLVQLPPIDAAARACELLLEDDTASVVGADFGDSVRGESIRQAPRTAVTFYRTEDAPISRSAVRIRLVGGGEMKITTARCFDREGHPLPASALAIDG